MFYEIEKLHYMIYDTSEVDWMYVDELEISPQRLNILIDQFLLSLLPNHELSGKDWYKLQGISQWIRQGNHLTNRQKRYALVTMAINWEQLDLLKIQ